jgi:hypothetical protein
MKERVDKIKQDKIISHLEQRLYKRSGDVGRGYEMREDKKRGKVKKGEESEGDEMRGVRRCSGRIHLSITHAIVTLKQRIVECMNED